MIEDEEDPNFDPFEKTSSNGAGATIPPEVVEEEEVLEALAAEAKKPKGPKAKKTEKDAPEVKEAPTVEGVILAKLGPNELPVVGKHYVLWGSSLMNDLRGRPVTVKAHVTLNEYVAAAVEHTQLLVGEGLKNPMFQDKDRIERTRLNAKWRYLGFICGQIDAL